MSKRGKSSILVGWKEIASFLNVSARTAQRYEQEGLPVRRPRQLKTVIAVPEEVRGWQLAQGKRQWIPWGIGAFVLVAAAAAVVWFWLLDRSIDPNPAFAELQDRNRLVVYNASREKLWEQFFPHGRFRGIAPRHLGREVLDLDDDGINEVLFLHELENSDIDNPERLICYEANGDVRWEYLPGYSVNWDERSFSSVYSIYGGFSIGSRGEGDHFIVIGANNKPSFASQISVLDGAGRLIGEYWNTGYIFDHDVIDLDQDGVDEILLGGINNYHKAPFFAVIDHDLPRSISPVEEGYALGFATGNERAYFLLPRTDVAEALSADSRVFRAERLSNNTFMVEVEVEQAGETHERTYRFDSDCNLLSLEFPQDFLALHKKLEREGLLDYEFDTEPEREQLMKIKRLVGGEKQ